ncbi:hypothetical protein [Yonghaparkia sp. Soil809]|uniref:hypothetical protein n=1 Tax=Yonghaparkia sp. Soil809 TaxID=1736417 RepID=UPI0006FF4468|nr:hypothetical protein [Yonghaparkia sp. Soil809]KRF32657.1 hypothetical protein ASG83_00940 [Yonghaparkia sp. Soil809]
MTPHDPRTLTVEEFRRREAALRRGYPIALAVGLTGAAITLVVWAIATGRTLTLVGLSGAPTPARLAEAITADSLEAELLLIGAALVWLATIIAIVTSNRLSRLRSRAARRR